MGARHGHLVITQGKPVVLCSTSSLYLEVGEDVGDGQGVLNNHMVDGCPHNTKHSHGAVG